MSDEQKTEIPKPMPTDLLMRRHLEKMLGQMLMFTGKLELNFKDGKLMDINETKRTKLIDLLR